MPDETLEQEIAELTARIATAEEKLRQFRQDISRRASRNAPIYDDLIRAAEMQRL
jgi:septal ring factor EnvC (AmiA/AmiB activator)